MEQGILTIKLNELEQQYGKLLSRIQLYQEKDHDRIRGEIRKMEEECEQMELMLERRVTGSRSEEAAGLASAQQDYSKAVAKILHEKRSGFGRADVPEEKEAEAAILYAEFAADFAVQSRNYALLAALTALDMQLTCEEKGEKKDE